MKIFLDDIRPAPEGYTLVRTVKECIKLLQTKQVTEISLDHDLGGKETGNDVIIWIERGVYLNGYVPPKIKIHSANPPAKKKMKMGIEKIESYMEGLD